MAAEPKRVAVYCRKSVAKGLDTEFNTLDAQRQAVESFIASQREDGWVALPHRYDDGGFTGSNTDRPALQALLRDVQAGEVDVVAVYKIDRLSRSIRDFVEIADLLERHGVAFVSVTQQFSTATSMGRLTLNMLMSFAEYEREVIAERIRDKVQASRRRGQWTGGLAPLGFDAVDRRLVVNPDEADQVRAIFELYIERGTIRATVDELNHRGWTNKTRPNRKDGGVRPGQAFNRSSLHALLTNPTYRGLTRCGDDLVPGQHDAIVDEALWDQAQALRHQNSQGTRTGTRNKSGALLRGLLRCGRCGSAMTHTFSTKKDRRYRYYTCAKLHSEGAESCEGARVPAGEFERYVVDQVRLLGQDETLIAATAAQVEDQAETRLRRHRAEKGRLEAASETHGDRYTEVQAGIRGLEPGVDAEALRSALHAFGPVWDQLFPRERERLLHLLLESVTYEPEDGSVELELRPCGIARLAQEAEDAA